MHATTERVVLVDRHDRELGEEEKLRAHAQGMLHRAFSVFVTNSRGELLLQRRAVRKYHSGGLWSNTCCGHPRPGEILESAAGRRLWEEMGFRCELTRRFGFLYRVELANGMWEHEFDHVLVGEFDGDPAPDPAEVMEWRWVGVGALRAEMAARPHAYTHWFPMALDGLLTRCVA